MGARLLSWGRIGLVCALLMLWSGAAASLPTPGPRLQGPGIPPPPPDNVPPATVAAAGAIVEPEVYEALGASADGTAYVVVMLAPAPLLPPAPPPPAARAAPAGSNSASAAPAKPTVRCRNTVVMGLSSCRGLSMPQA